MPLTQKFFWIWVDSWVKNLFFSLLMFSMLRVKSILFCIINLYLINPVFFSPYIYLKPFNTFVRWKAPHGWLLHTIYFIHPQIRIQSVSFSVCFQTLVTKSRDGKNNRPKCNLRIRIILILCINIVCIHRYVLCSCIRILAVYRYTCICILCIYKCINILEITIADISLVYSLHGTLYFN